MDKSILIIYHCNWKYLAYLANWASTHNQLPLDQFLALSDFCLAWAVPRKRWQCDPKRAPLYLSSSLTLIQKWSMASFLLLIHYNLLYHSQVSLFQFLFLHLIHGSHFILETPRIQYDHLAWPKPKETSSYTLGVLLPVTSVHCLRAKRIQRISISKMRKEN